MAFALPLGYDMYVGGSSLAMPGGAVVVSLRRACSPPAGECFSLAQGFQLPSAAPLLGRKIAEEL